MPSAQIEAIISDSKTWLDFFGRSCRWLMTVPNELSRVSDAYSLEGGTESRLVAAHHRAVVRSSGLMQEHLLSNSILSNLDDWMKKEIRSYFDELSGRETVVEVAVMHGTLCALDAQFQGKNEEVIRSGWNVAVVPRCPSPAVVALKLQAEELPSPAELVPYRLRLILKSIYRMRNLHPILPEYAAVLERVKLKTLDRLKWSILEARLSSSPLKIAVVQFLNRLDQMEMKNPAQNRFLLPAWRQAGSGKLRDVLRAALENLSRQQIRLAVFPEIVIPADEIDASLDWLRENDIFSESPILLAFGSQHRCDEGAWGNTSALYWVGKEHGKAACEKLLTQAKQNPFSFMEKKTEMIEAIQSSDQDVHMVNTPFGRIGLVICRDFIADDRFFLAFKGLALDWIVIPALTPETDKFEVRVRELGYHGTGSALANSCAAMHLFKNTTSQMSKVSRIYVPYRESPGSTVWQDCSQDPCDEYGALIHIWSSDKVRDRHTERISSIASDRPRPDLSQYAGGERE
jgi:hypothetical protein